ncbi:GNAT family N-acetyltransferase [Nocardioides sambongensis]|uniref:GNAT family N-acetyltransferase n=1 Tax=Nocardioides sambongensis TaxID=2589074 RepID=UPI00112E1700|nr:GNAT family N-acetyltransferase [Nocardioides sambongensis]
MTTRTALPAGLTTRPLHPGDARAVFEVIADSERHDIGTVEIEEADIVSDWQRPSHDLASSSVAVLDGARLVAFAELISTDRYDAGVHPDARGRGIGTWLAHWVQDLARSRGARVIGMPVPEDSPGDRLLTGLGYRIRWTSWVLRLGAGEEVAARPLPAGYRLREAVEADRPQIHTVLEDAFLEWSQRPRQSLEDFAAGVWERPGFEPWHLQVVTCTAPAGDQVADTDRAGTEQVGTEQVVGVAFAWNVVDGDATDTYVDRLAVAADHRDRGLAQALLVATFAEGRRRGATTSSLSTDSRTGALSLYRKVGMRPDSVWLHRAIDLTP